MTNSKKFIVVGQITKPHGIRGAVHVVSFCDPPANLLTFASLYYEGGEKASILRTQATARGDFFIFQLEGVRDRNQAEALRNQKLFITREQLPEPDGDTYYYEDLVGFVVCDEAGVTLGCVASLTNFGAQDILVVHEGGADEILIPFLKDVTVDMDRKTIIVPQYLIIREG